MGEAIAAAEALAMDRGQTPTTQLVEVKALHELQLNSERETMSALKVLSQQQLASHNGEAEAVMAEQLAELAAYKEEAEAAIADQQREIDAHRASAEQAVAERVQQAVAAAEAAATDSGATGAQIQQLKALHELELEAEREEAARKVAVLERKLAAAVVGVPVLEVEEAEARHREQLELLKTLHQKQLGAHGEAAEEAEARHSEQLELLKTLHQKQMRAHAEAAEAELVEHEAELAVQKEAVEASAAERVQHAIATADAAREGLARRRLTGPPRQATARRSGR